MSNIEKIRQKIENSIKAFEFNGGIYDSYEAGELSAYKEILDFIDSLPKDDPLNDPRFGKGFDAGRAVQRIFDGTDEDSLPEETCKDSLQVKETCKENPDSFTDKPKELEEAAIHYLLNEHSSPLNAVFHRADLKSEMVYHKDIENAFIAGAKWMANQMPMPEDTVIFMKGVEEGRRLEREDRNDDNLPRYYGN